MFDNFFKKRFFVTAFVMLMMVYGFFSCGLFGSKSKFVEGTDYFMNTFVTVKIYVNNRKKGEELIDRAFAEAKNIERIMEPRKGNGELKRINSSPVDTWWKLSPELKTVIDRSFFLTKNQAALSIRL